MAKAPEFDQPFISHFGEMLRYSRLADPAELDQSSDGCFLALGQPAQNEQAPLIRERLQKHSHLRSIVLQLHNSHVQEMPALSIRFRLYSEYFMRSARYFFFFAAVRASLMAFLNVAASNAPGTRK